MSRDGAPWIVSRRADPRATLRLFCFPYAGAGGQAFRGLRAALPRSIDVCPIELPGRWTRIREPLLRSMPEMVDALVSGIAPYLDVPFALLGYSFGSVVAFEFARRLRREHRGTPRHLVLNAYGHPAASRPRLLHALPDDDLVHTLAERYGGLEPAVVNDRAMLAIVLPIVRADLQVVETYEYAREPPLGCPITVFGGELDRATTPEGLEHWRNETTSVFRSVTFPGATHFFINQLQHDYASRVATALTGLQSLDHEAVANAQY